MPQTSKRSNISNGSNVPNTLNTQDVQNAHYTRQNTQDTQNSQSIQNAQYVQNIPYTQGNPNIASNAIPNDVLYTQTGPSAPSASPSAASTVSVVVPCFNEEENLPLFYEKFVHVALDMAN